MANTSVVCTDKTRTLTQNVMSVVASSIGIHAKFIHNLKENKARMNTPDQEQDQPQEQDVTDTNEPQVNCKHADDFSTEQDNINMINSTAFEDIGLKAKQLGFAGSEATLLRFAKDLGWENLKETREPAKIIQMIPFSSERKTMGVVVPLWLLSFVPEALAPITEAPMFIYLIYLIKG